MTIWRWQHDPQIAFPAPVKLGINGRNFWWLPAIRDWEQRRRNPVSPSRSAP
jgi:predicted DNA-binding transcriptional regulator AlpA